MSLTGSAETTNNLKVLKGKIRSLSPYAVDKTLSVEGAAADAKTVGDALEKKVSTTDVVDNLTTKDGKKPLSANQGVALKKSITDLTSFYEELKGDVEQSFEEASSATKKAQTAAEEAQTTAENAQTAVNEAKNYASGLSGTYNLLDNSNFKNPVNRSRKNTWEIGTTEEMAIDNWYGIRGLFTATNAGMTVAWDGKNDSNGYIQNQIPRTIATGTKVTVAAKIGSTIHLAVLTVPSDNGAFSYGETKDSIKLRFGTTATHYLVGLVLESDEEKTVEWMAAYPGEYTEDTIPAYIPKGYRVEALNTSSLAFDITAKLTADKWTEADGRFTQEVEIGEILEKDKPVIDCDLTDIDTEEAEEKVLYGWGRCRRINTEDGKIKAIFAEKPEVDIPIKIKVVR